MLGPRLQRTSQVFVLKEAEFCCCIRAPYPQSRRPFFIPARKAGFDLGMRNGMVVAVPNPAPMSGGAGIDAAIHEALEQAEARGLKGRDITPFVLASVNETTGGHSLKSNVALVRRKRAQHTRAACYAAAQRICGRLCAVWAYVGWLGWPESTASYGLSYNMIGYQEKFGWTGFIMDRTQNPVKCVCTRRDIDRRRSQVEDHVEACQ